MAALRLRYAPPPASHGATGDNPLTINPDHSMGAGHSTGASDGRELLSTISLDLVQDWLAGLRVQCGASQYEVLLEAAGLSHRGTMPTNKRVTRDEFVKLYQVVMVGTGDEMVGLWTRPIRKGTLKFLCTTMMEASSICTALYRFTRFWNLLLDDFRIQMIEEDGVIRVGLSPRGPQYEPHRFGHMLLLKLAHGILSWLAGHELPVQHVGFGFSQPHFVDEYSILFPSTVSFGEPISSISFERRLGALPIKPRKADLRDFLVRSPRDWLFTAYSEHALHLKIRELVSLSRNVSGTLEQAARTLNMSPRTLIRKLAADGTSFQEIKDGVRRDRAIRELVHTSKSLTCISYEIGFSSPAVFHRAFRRWTGVSPSIYRQRFQ